ncbi:MAG: aminopeptidase [Spirochaetales bacterium]|nr:aminopeptidase [Spirochaetales bacterium]
MIREPGGPKFRVLWRRNKSRTLAKVCLCFFSAGLLTSCYVFQQALPFLSHHLCARPNEKLLRDAETDADTIEFLSRVEDIRAFAIEELGLEETKNYSSFYSIDTDYLAAVVQAAPEFSIDPYLFSYPVLGRLPYKGFYDPDQARREAAKLKTRGLDVFIRPVDAFSSLGYFRDPLFSFMVDYSAAGLAELIIHEQTHATIFVKGQPGFNEKLATVVGREGARQYVVSRFGESSEQYIALTASRRDSEQFSRDMFDLGQRLTAVYALDIPPEEKRRLKAETIELFQHEFAEHYKDRYDGEAYREAANMALNNAYLSLFRIYEEPDRRLERLMEKTGGIRQMLDVLKPELEGSESPPWEIVDGMLAG